MTCYISNNIVTFRTPEMLEFCCSNLVLNNPEYANKKKMGLWLGNTPEKIHLFELRSDKVIIPFGCLQKIYPLIEKQEIQTDFADIPISILGKVPLYDYQEEAVGIAIKAKNGVLVSAAGSGKTQMGIEIICRIGKKALWLTHTKELLQQSKSRTEQYLQFRSGTITEGKIDIGDITFATVQTMSKLDLASLKHEFSVIIVDECHRVAGSPTQLTMFSKVINALACRYKYGLTATPHRADGMTEGMYSLIGDIFHTVGADKTANKTIKAKIKPIYTDYELDYDSEAIDTDGTIIFTKLVNELCFNETRNKLIAELIKQNENESCIVLSDRLSQLRELKSLVGYGVMIDGNMTSKTGKEKREKAIRDMKSGNQKLLFASYNLAKEGLDIPSLSRLFYASPKKDYAVIVQSAGRIERKVDGKDPGIVYDFVDNIGICLNMFKARKAHYKKNGNQIIL